MRTRSEGIRRLSLLLGLAGGLLGCMGSFGYWGSVAQKEQLLALRLEIAERDQTIYEMWGTEQGPADERDRDVAIEYNKGRKPEDRINKLQVDRIVSRFLREEIKAFSEGVEYTPPKPPPSKPPGFAEYLPIAVIPVVGFLIPWGGIRVIAWVIEGFLADRKRNRGAPP